jgi:spermidine synthase
VGGRYQLSTNDAIYSWADKYANFKRVFDQMNLADKPQQKVLVLGLGLASIPVMLQKMGHRYHYTGVELDEEVIYLASKYVLDEIATDMTVIQADAAHYVEQCSEVFDIITMDIFIGQMVPGKFWTETFVAQLKGLLKEDGVIIYNTIARTEELAAASMQFYQGAFSPHFDRPAAIPIKGNLMLISNTDYLRVQ